MTPPTDLIIPVEPRLL